MAANEQEEFEFRARAEREATQSPKWEPAIPALAPNAKSGVQEMAQYATAPVRGTRALGVGAERLLQGVSATPAMIPGQQPGPKMALQMVKNLPFATERAAEATKPGFQPQAGEKLGSAAGEMAGIAGLTAPLAGGAIASGLTAGATTALMQKSETGKVDPMAVAANAALAGGLGFVSSLTPKVLSESAQDSALKAFGFTKRFTGSDKAISQGKDAVQTMMDNGVLKGFPSSQDIAERVSDIQSRSGSRIGQILDSVDSKGRFFDPKKAIASLQELRPVGDNGQILRGGHYDELNSRLNDAIKTIQAHGSDPTSLKAANQVKALFQSRLKPSANNAPTVMDHMIAGRFRQEVDDQLASAADKIGNPELAKEFATQKKLYSDSMRVEDPIYNRISSEIGNKGISLTDWIMAAPEMAAGNPKAAIMLMLGKRGAERLGPSTMANLKNDLSKIPNPMESVNREAVPATIYSFNQPQMQQDNRPQSPPPHIMDAFRSWMDSLKHKGDQK